MRTALLAKAGLTVATAATALIVNTGTAGAAGLDGSDPAYTGCDSGAYTAKSAYARIGSTAHALVELRYSPHCRTTWARITTMNMPACHVNSDNCGYAVIHRNSDGTSFGCDIANGKHGCYTPQVNDAGVTSYASGEVAVGALNASAKTGSW